MVKTALVTGASGFLGREVFRTFQAAGWKAVGTGWKRTNPPTILKLDLSDSTEITSALQKIQ